MKRLSEFGLMLVAALVWTLAYLMPNPGMLQGLDFVRYYSFNGAFLRNSLLAGEFPWWNPYVALGRPFADDLQTAVFYPGTWLLVGLGVSIGTIMNLVLHLALGGWGMMQFCRATGLRVWTARFLGLWWMIALPLSVRALSGQIHYVDALAWLPVSFWLSWLWAREHDCRVVAWLAIAAAMQFAAGHPQVFWLTQLGVGVFLVANPAELAGRRWLSSMVGWLVSIALAGLVTAPLWAPFWSMIETSSRGLGGGDLMANGALRPVDWLAVVLPSKFGFLADAENQLQLGLPIVLLAGFGVWRNGWMPGVGRALLVVAVVGAGLATGWPGALDEFKLLVPGMGIFRMPGRLVILVVLSGLWWAGRAWDDELKGGGPVVGVLLAVILAMVASWTLVDGPTRAPALWWLGGVGIAAWLGLQLVAQDRRLGLIILGLSLLGDAGRGWVAARPWYVLPQTFPAEEMLPGLVSELRAEQGHPAPPRINLSARWARENFGMIAGYSTFNGYTSLYDRGVWEAIHEQAALPVPKVLTSFPDVRIWEQSPFLFEGMCLAFGYDRASGEFVVNQEVEPRAFTVRTPIDRVIGGMEDQVRITAFSLNAVVLEVDLMSPATVVLAEAFAPAWRVTVDGVPEHGYRAKQWMRAVDVAAGKHRIYWHYEAWTHARLTGCLGFLLGLTGVTLLVGRRRHQPVHEVIH